MMKQKADNLIAQNKKANHNYFVKGTLEAGTALTGTGVKSVHTHRINLRDGYVQIINGSAFLENVHISEYKRGNHYNHDPSRSRRLLLHKREIVRLAGIQTQQGVAIIPLKAYLKHGFTKVLIGVGQGKKQYDERQTIKKRDQDRGIRRRYGI